MLSSFYQNLQFSIRINEAECNDSNNIIFEEWNDFILPKEGVYTVEGKNRAGKSILIKMIMGVLPPTLYGTNEKNVFIQGKSVNIRNVKDAYNAGLSAVFQDDQLIPTMTIREQIYLRHLNRKSIKQILWFLTNLFLRILKFKALQPLGVIKNIDGRIEAFLKRFEISQGYYNKETYLDQKINEWFEKFEINSDVLEKLPSQLSGGTIAKIRIVNCLLTENIKILFLDEALNSVAYSDCIRIIDLLKNWATQIPLKAIVVVTHKNEEILRWQPAKRFYIKNSHVSEIDLYDYDSIDIGIQNEHRFIYKFSSFDRSKSYLKELENPIFFLIDENIRELSVVKNVINFLGFSYSNKDSGIMYLKCNESIKSIDEYTSKVMILLRYFTKSKGTLIIIGGGTLINFGSFLASTIHRGTINLVVFPTTLMAISDVAIGSKAALNIIDKDNNFAFKNVIGTYKDPNAIIMDSSFLRSQKAIEKLNGLAECIKHGLLQDGVLFNNACSIIMQSSPDSDECFKIGLITQDLKSKTLIIDGKENSYGRVLLYGHLHAHSIERLLNFSISHGLSVYWGLLLELSIGSNQEIFNKLFNTLKSSIVLEELAKNILNKLNSENFEDRLRDIYNSDSKYQHSSSIDQFNIILLENIGEYSSIPSILRLKEVSWEIIIENINILIQKIRSSKI
jgi:3-dehydroquinate synthase